MLQIVQIKKLLEDLLEYVHQDYANHQDDETQTFLYKVLYGTVDGNYDFYQQAKKLFLRTQENPNNLKVIYEYPKDRSSIPVYVIREPGKIEGPANSIGKIEKFIGDIPQYRDNRQFNFEIMCFSTNMMESILMSEIMYALLLGAYDILASRYLLIDYSMKELMMENNLMPTPIFIRSIGLNLVQDEVVPGTVDSILLGKIIFGEVNQKDSYVYDILP